ncbi:MAG: purine-nucleoside phosphorylase [Clostridiales bacterium]|nr:purine-nucleoside phosphorylase [Clostridiales bacterium]
MMSIPTAHNTAKKGEMAKTVLMPGDPLRAKFIAETYLENARLVNNVRGIQGYTGSWKGAPVSVMASGMGIPSMGIYSYELYNFYDVENIIRIGSAGAISDDLKLRDIVFGLGACTNSDFAAQFELPGTFAPTASYELLKIACEKAEGLGLAPVIGNILSSDTFYDDRQDAMLKWKGMGVLAVEMEAAGLYMNAARAGKNALAICTISDHVITGEALDAEARQVSFTQMMELALSIAQALDAQ